MKHLFVGDLHLGVNENDEAYLSYQKKSLDWIVETAEKLDVNLVHFLGDMFHNRNSLTHKSIALFNYFMASVGNRCGVIVVGNHDCFYKNTNNLNAPELLANDKWISGYDCVDFHNMLFVPWVNKENVVGLSAQIKKAKNKICAGHFELSGFKMGKGIDSKHDTVDRKLLNKFDLVISGHYHSHSHKDNIVYLGSPYEMNFTDEGEDKIIGLLEDGELTYIKNPYSYYKQVVVKSEKDLLEISELTDKKVKVKLECDRTIKIEKWLSGLKDKVDCDVFEPKEKVCVDINIKINKMEIKEIWTEFLDAATVDANKEEINNIFLEEYNKVINGE